MKVSSTLDDCYVQNVIKNGCERTRIYLASSAPKIIKDADKDVPSPLITEFVKCIECVLYR